MHPLFSLNSNTTANVLFILLPHRCYGNVTIEEEEGGIVQLLQGVAGSIGEKTRHFLNEIRPRQVQ